MSHIKNAFVLLVRLTHVIHAPFWGDRRLYGPPEEPTK